MLAQGAAIRARDVDGVVREVSAFQAELERRTRLEEDRSRLLTRAGAALGVAPGAVTLTQLTPGMTIAEAELACTRSAELQGLLAELTREHTCNQALMRQELAFLDHLLRLVDPETPAAGYANPAASRAAEPARRPVQLSRPRPPAPACRSRAFMGLQTSLRGLLAHQQAIDTTGHNVANANTPGYSRQEAVLAPTQPFVVPANSVLTGAGAQLGTGVDVATIRRIRDAFLDVQYRAQSTSLGDATARSNSLDQVELAFAEPTDDGLAAQLTKFWNAWSDVANAPEDAGARAALVTSAQTLTSSFQTLSAQLTTVAQQAQSEYDAITGPSGDVGNWAQELAGLNTSIRDAVFRGQSPNDLMDRRDQLIDQLSSLAQVSVTDLGNGAVKIDFGGVTLVDPSAAGGYTWPQTLTTPGGKLGALLDLASPAGAPLTYRSQLDAVAADLVSSVNALHTATPFFNPAGTTAAAIAVVATPATVQTGSGAASGENDVAQAIAALRGGTTDQLYGALVAQVGIDVQANTSAESTAQSLADAVESRRQSVAGVSLDEEMTNLIRFQRGYQASARTMTTLDDMLDTLINRTGRAGL